MYKDRCTVTGLWYHATQSRLRFLSLLIHSSNTTFADRQIVGNTEIALKKWWSHTAMRELTLLVVTCSLSDSRQFIRPRRIYQGANTIWIPLCFSLCCDIDIQNEAVSNIFQVQYYFPRHFLQVPRAKTQTIFES